MREAPRGFRERRSSPAPRSALVTRPFVFHRLAASELGAAEHSYEKERPGKGLRFVTVVEAAISLLTQHPESAPVVRGAIRGKVLQRYPYTIYYTVKDDTLRILAVAHQRGHLCTGSAAVDRRWGWRAPFVIPAKAEIQALSAPEPGFPRSPS